jgi:hypothetical protein
MHITPVKVINIFGPTKPKTENCMKMHTHYGGEIIAAEIVRSKRSGVLAIAGVQAPSRLARPIISRTPAAP